MTQSTQNRSFILVTGAAGGLGKAFAVECASRGWDVYLTDLRAEPLATLAQHIASVYAVRVLNHPCDLTDPADRARLFAHLRAQGVRLWGLINVAGLDFEGVFFEQSCQDIRTILRVNIEGTLEMIHSAVPLRDPCAPFRIINVASLAAFYPMPVKATYAASKRFLLDFSRALADEVREMGITVTVLCPAGLPTTPEVIRSIEAQGVMGQLTTQNIGSVANETLNAALRGQQVVIPGALNRLLQLAGGLVPTGLLVSMIGARWRAARGSHTKPAASLAQQPIP